MISIEHLVKEVTFVDKKVIYSNSVTFICSVVGLAFIMLHLGVDSSSPLNHGCQFLDGECPRNHKYDF